MKRTLALVFIVLLCVGAVAHFSTSDLEARAKIPENHNLASKSEAPALLPALPASSGRLVTAASTEPLAPRANGVISKRAEVLALARSDDPEDKFAAYKAAQACFDAREKYVHTPGDAPGDPGHLSLNPNAMKEQSLCGDLSTTEILQRLQWLEAAAAAGVRGAAQAFINGGPNGYGYSQNGDPTWESKISGFLEAGAKNRDVYALLVLSHRHESGPKELQDPLISLAYYELAMEASLEQRGRNLPQEEVVVRRLTAGLTPEQLAGLAAVKNTLLDKGR